MHYTRCLNGWKSIVSVVRTSFQILSNSFHSVRPPGILQSLCWEVSSETGLNDHDWCTLEMSRNPIKTSNSTLTLSMSIYRMWKTCTNDIMFQPNWYWFSCDLHSVDQEIVQHPLSWKNTSWISMNVNIVIVEYNPPWMKENPQFTISQMKLIGKHVRLVTVEYNSSW